jgi:hypothetical protein
MPKTPWANSNSSLPSDYIKPSPSLQNKGKAKVKGNDHQKSAAVLSLERQLDALRSPTCGSKNDPAGGCFCLGDYFDS